MSRMVKLNITSEDIANAVCGNRRKCVLATAMRREFKLEGHSYVNVDGAEAAYSADGLRHVFRMPRTAVRYLREFDSAGEQYGQEAARATTKPRAFTFQEISVHPITPPASPERREQINTARRIREAELAALGLKPKTYKRWAGM